MNTFSRNMRLGAGNGAYTVIGLALLVVVPCGAAPGIVLTNPAAVSVRVPYTQAVCRVAGTNTGIVGGISVIVNHRTTNSYAVTNPFICDVNVNVGPNLVTVTGTNSAGIAATDSVMVFRWNYQGVAEGWGDGFNSQTNCPDRSDLVMVAAGTYGDHSIALDTRGGLEAWGNNSNGQTNCPSDTGYGWVAAGSFHSLALQSNGALMAWGDNYYGQTNCPPGTGYAAIAAGDYHSLALRSDGTVVGWGYDYYGETNSPPGSGYVAVAAGSYHSLALRADGTVVGWGCNLHGETNCPQGSYIAVAAGGHFSVALSADGTVVAWGDNFQGQTMCPTGTYTAVAAGGNHSVARATDGTVVAWGNNMYGQTNRPAGNNFTAVAAGDKHSLALRLAGPMLGITNPPAAYWTVSNGVVACAIVATNGGVAGKIGVIVNQGATNWQTATQPFATNIALLTGENEVTLVATNVVGGWTRGAVVILRAGPPFIDITSAPTIVEQRIVSAILAGTNNVQVRGDMWVSNATMGSVAHAFPAKPCWTAPAVNLAVGTNVIAVWGTNVYGVTSSDTVVVMRNLSTVVIVNPAAVARTVPYTQALYRVMATNASIVGSMGVVMNQRETNWYAAGNPFTVDVGLNVGPNLIRIVGTNRAGWWATDTVLIHRRNREGTLVGWGASFDGETNCLPGDRYVAVSAGQSHGLALDIHGTLAAWGGNWAGETNCPPGGPYTAIAAGAGHSVALAVDGSLVAWGDPQDGRTNCPAGNNYVAVAAGNSHNVALRADGTLVAWGANVEGQTDCPAGDGYVAIAAGGMHSVALTMDGTLVGWGANMSGETDCPAGNGYLAVAAGGMHSIALTLDGTLVGWGSDVYGQTHCPVGIGHTAIAAGGSHSVALRGNGTLRAWGLDVDGLTDCPPGNEYFSVACGANFSLAIGIPPASNAPPDAPVNTSPSQGAMNQPPMPILAASVFSDRDFGDTHAASRWQLAMDSEFMMVVWDSGEDDTHLTLATVPYPLSPMMLYYWRVKYKDSRGMWSTQSSPTLFETASAYDTNAVPTVTPVTIDFSTNRTVRTIAVRNDGGGNFTYLTSVTSMPRWLHVSPAAGAVTNMPCMLVARATRTSLAPGVYTGTITVTPSVGGPLVVMCQMEVVGNSVVANAGGPYVGDQGSPALLDGAASVGNGLQYRWTVAGKEVAPLGVSNIVYRHTVYVPGTNTVWLNVLDNNVPPIGASNATTLIIRNVGPVVYAGGPYTGSVGRAISFRATIADPGTGDTHQVRWNFGAGWTAWQGAVATNTFLMRGDYAVKCEARDNYGAVGHDSVAVVIDMSNHPPVAAATLGTSGMKRSNIGGMHVPVLLDGSQSFDEESGTNLYFDWREDVDNPAKPIISDAARHQSNVVIASFPMPGVYKFHLVVNDGTYNSEPVTVLASIPGLSGMVRTDGMGAVLPLYGVTLTVTNEALGQVFTSTTDFEGKYVLDTGGGNGRIVVLSRNGVERIASVNVPASGNRDYTLWFMPQVCSFSDLVNSGYYGGVWGAIPDAAEQMIIGTEVAFNGVGNLAGEIPFSGIPELWPRHVTLSYPVVVQAYGWRSEVLPIQPDPASTLSLWTSLTPCPDACTVNGIVVGTNGSPVSGIAVNFGPAFGAVNSGTDGTFTISGMMRGHYYVRLSAPHFDTTYQYVQVPPGDTTLQLQKPLRIRGGRFSVYGEVVDGESGRPVGSAHVSVINVAGRRAMLAGMPASTNTVTVSRTGYYDVSVDKGTRTLRYEAAGYAPQEMAIVADGHVQQNVQLAPVPEPVAVGAAAVIACSLLAQRSRMRGARRRN